MLWQLLVTDEHVRAARLRVVQPWLIAFGCILILLGFLLMRLVSSQPAPASAREQVALRVSQAQIAAAAPFSRLSLPQVNPANAASLPHVDDVPILVKNITQSLDSNGTLPSEAKPFQKVDRDTFFKGDWPLDTSVYLQADDNYVIATTINTQPPRYQYYAPTRWIGMFKRVKGKWSYATLETGTTYLPRGLPVVEPRDIPLTLSAFFSVPVKQ